MAAQHVKVYLAALATPQAARGPGDPISAAAAHLADRWRDGDLKARGATIRCANRERRLEALVDARGAVLVLAIREDDRVDVHLYREDGSEAGSARFVGAARREFLLAPLPEPAARAELSAPACEAMPADRP